MRKSKIDELEEQIRNCEIQLKERDLTGSKAQFYSDEEKRLAKCRARNPTSFMGGSISRLRSIVRPNVTNRNRDSNGRFTLMNIGDNVK